jgi:hypothetical protein
MQIPRLGFVKLAPDSCHLTVIASVIASSASAARLAVKTDGS